MQSVTDFRRAFGIGRNAVKNGRTAVLLSVLVFVAADASIHEGLHHHYVLAALFPLFFLIVMPWLACKVSIVW
jgi:hypothetical protein